MLSKKNKIIKKQILNHINFFENISLIKFILNLPFVFALDNIFYQNYKNKSFYFLSKNHYIRNNKRQELINWETFNFFIINQINKKNQFLKHHIHQINLNQMRKVQKVIPSLNHKIRNYNFFKTIK